MRSFPTLMIGLLLVSACTGTGGGQQNQSSSSSSSSVVSSVSASSQPYAHEIQVTMPLANATITSPLGIQGRALGNWFFEASFPVILKDGHGQVIAQDHVNAIGNWMTTSFVPFSASVPFTTPTTATGTLVLQNDNPSGDPSRSKEIDIPVHF